jgi:hypothetical protein
LLPRLRDRGLEDLAGLAIDELETERGGALPQSASHSRPLLTIVGVGAGIPVHECSVQDAIFEDFQYCPTEVETQVTA